MSGTGIFYVCTFSSSFFRTGSAQQSLGGYVGTRPCQSYVGFAQAISLSLARMMLRGSMPSSGRQVYEVKSLIIETDISDGRRSYVSSYTCV